MTPDEERRLIAWVDQMSAGRNRITDNTIDQVLRLMESLSGGVFYNQDRVDEVAETVADQVRAAQESIADLTSAYLDQVLDVFDTPRTDAPVLPARLRAVDPLEEWRRPAEQYRYARSQDVPEDEAVQRALRRAEVLAETDLSLAHREAARQKLAPVEKIRGYRRIIRPELAKSGQTCGLCVAAADQFYFVADLLPIHIGCNCEVLPVIDGKADPKNVGYGPGRLYTQLSGTGASELSNQRVEVKENGEIGPVLVAEGAAFRGPDEIAA